MLCSLMIMFKFDFNFFFYYQIIQTNNQYKDMLLFNKSISCIFNKYIMDKKMLIIRFTVDIFKYK